MVATTLFLASVAAAAGADKGYCEPCDDQTMQGIRWTSKNRANNYELDGVTRRNDVYKVVVKQACAAGFKGTATRVCTGNGEWQTPDLSECVSDPCLQVPADFDEYKKIDNAAMKENCKAGSPGQFECDVVCMPGFNPVAPKMRCLGGKWRSDFISCARGATVPAAGTTGKNPDAVTANSDPKDAANGSGALVPVLVTGGALALLTGAAFFFYKRSKNGAPTSRTSSE